MIPITVLALVQGVRRGRASIGILDSVHVEAYGTRMPINQVATRRCPSRP